MKNLIIILLALGVLGLSGYIVWGNKHKVPEYPAQTSEKTQETQNTTVMTNSQKAKVVFNAFDPSTREYLIPGQIVVEDLDGSEKKVSSATVARMSVDAYGIVGYGTDQTVWFGDNQGNFTPVADSLKLGHAIVSPNHSVLAYVKNATGNASQLQLWSISFPDNKETLLFDHLEQYGVSGFNKISPTAFSKDGQSIYLIYGGNSTQSYDGLSTDILVFNLQTKQIKKLHLSDENINQLAFSPDHAKIAFSGFDGKQFFVRDLASGVTQKFQGALPYGGTGSGQLWSPDGTKLVYGVSNETSNTALPAVMYLNVTDNSTHTVALSSEADTFYWLDNETVLTLQQTYNTKNPFYWDRSSTIYNLKTGEHSDFTEPPYAQGLLGVIPAQAE